MTIPMVDLFAGPGGLNEGFSRAGGPVPFRSAISIEMERWAHETLILRAAVRSLGFPDEYYAFLNGEMTERAFRALPEVAEALRAENERSPQLELGEANRPDNDGRIRSALADAGVLEDPSKPWALIGGPPCQAYSMAGRARRKHDETFAEDKKHFLYREYLHILATFRPPVFVMENVRGMLSSKNKDNLIFRQIRQDLQLDGAYSIHSLVSTKAPEDLLPTDFLIHADRFGIPQARERVILLGIRNDVLSSIGTLPVLDARPHTSVRDAIADLPPVRSQMSPRRLDSDIHWAEERKRAAQIAHRSGLQSIELPESLPTVGGQRVPLDARQARGTTLRDWFTDPRQTQVLHHEARSHMPSDLWRYFYLARLVELTGGAFQPDVKTLPTVLLPNHKNVLRDDTPFMDRFRVQSWDGPSSTVVAHLAKDGHHFIHPDPLQMRSLTVREAARLQTFPDDYYFTGPRTAQYQQVGNAVPPLLANQIGEVVHRILKAAFPSSFVSKVPTAESTPATTSDGVESDAA